MPYITELYVNSSGSATNGGSGTGAPKLDETALNNVDAVQTSGVTHTLENKDNDGWGTTAVGDWLVFDVASAKVLCVVSALAVGGDTDIIQVKRLTGSTSFAATGKGVRVGGSWDKPSTAATFLNAVGQANASAAGISNGIVRANVNAATYSESAHVSFSGTWANSLMLYVEGYTSTPGDIDCLNDESLPLIDFGTGDYQFSVSGNNTTAVSLKITSAYSGAGRNLAYIGGSRTLGVNVWSVYTGTASGTVSLLVASMAVRCVGEKTTTAAAGKCVSCTGQIFNCVAIGYKTGGTYYGSGIVLSGNGAKAVGCVAYNCTVGIDCQSFNQLVSNCTVGNCTTGISSTYMDLVAISNKIGHCTTGFSATGDFRFVDYNEFAANTTNVAGTANLLATHNINTATEPFVDYTTNDLRPASGAAGNDAGWPGELWPGFTGYTDCGALGRQHSGTASQRGNVY